MPVSRSNRPTRQEKEIRPHASTGINAPPAWYGGEYFIRDKQWGSGAKHSGPSGRRATRYHPPVNDGKKITRK